MAADAGRSLSTSGHSRSCDHTAMVGPGGRLVGCVVRAPAGRASARVFSRDGTKMASATWSERLGKWWHDFKIVSLPSRLNRMHRVVTMPFSVFFLTYSAPIHPAYGMPQRRPISLAVRFFLNHIRMSSQASYRAQLVRATKRGELTGRLWGNVGVCRCYKGGMTVNLSLGCRIRGRRLLVYVSFEGMPPRTRPDVWPPDLPFI